MTLGWSTPLMNLNLQQMMIGNTMFGSMPFHFKGRAGPLYPAYGLCWVLTVVAAMAAMVAAVLLIVLSGLAVGSVFTGGGDMEDLGKLFI